MKYNKIKAKSCGYHFVYSQCLLDTTKSYPHDLAFILSILSNYHELYYSFENDKFFTYDRLQKVQWEIT